MLTLHRSHAKPPIGGHNFPGCGGLKADTIDELIAKVISYRAVNGLPFGNPEHEIAEHYLVIAPWYVVESNEPKMDKPLSLLVAEWVMDVWKQHQRRHEMFSTVALKRRETCRQCPFFTTRKMPVEGSYLQHADTRAILLSGTVDYASQGVCVFHHWPVAIASRLEKPHSVALLPAPEKCWVQAPE